MGGRGGRKEMKMQAREGEEEKDDTVDVKKTKM